jgi:hypothetical protein
MLKFHFMKQQVLFVLISFMLVLSGCQSAIEPKTIVDDQDAISSGTELSNLILNIVSLDGSEDNVIDLSSCTSVVFPVMGLFEGQEINFNSIEEVISLGVGALDIEWVFPIRVILVDHTELILINSDQLDDIRDACIEGGSDPDIECIDFVYPLELSIYNVQTELLQTKNAMSDEDLFKVFNGPDNIISIEYPVNLIDSKRSVLIAGNNEQLIESISGTIGTCDERDIIEFDASWFASIRQVLISSDWTIAQYEDVEDLTSIFSGYSINFRSDLGLFASGNGNDFEGLWGLDSYDSMDFLSLDFDTDDPDFILLNDDWKIIAFDQNSITMEAEADNGITTKRFRLEK